MAVRTYKQAFTHGSFTDFETELVINREEEAEIDDETAGRATLTAIANNRLVIVHEPKKKAADKKAADKKPEDK